MPEASCDCTPDAFSGSAAQLWHCHCQRVLISLALVDLNRTVRLKCVSVSVGSRLHSDGLTACSDFQ